MAREKLYIKQLLNNYKISQNEPKQLYSVDYQLNEKERCYKLFEHNEGIETVKRYISYLENKIEELECIESIIDVANMYGGKEGCLKNQKIFKIQKNNAY